MLMSVAGSSGTCNKVVMPFHCRSDSSLTCFPASFLICMRPLLLRCTANVYCRAAHACLLTTALMNNGCLQGFVVDDEDEEDDGVQNRGAKRQRRNVVLSSDSDDE